MTFKHVNTTFAHHLKVESAKLYSVNTFKYLLTINLYYNN